MTVPSTQTATPLARRRRWRTWALGALVLLTGAAGISWWRGTRNFPPLVPAATDPARHAQVAVFGATGLIGEGVLDAMLGDPHVTMVHVVTRRRTPTLDSAVASGRATVYLHDDFLDYAPLAAMLARIDATYWALGTSTVNVTDEEYSRIHVDYPVQFVTAWLGVRGPDAPLSFHLVSGSGASSESWFHWAREKARAERALADLSTGTGLRVVSYRPGGIVRTGSRARWYTAPIVLLKPISGAIEPLGIGEAMLEVTARGPAVRDDVLEARAIGRYAEAYRARRPVAGARTGQAHFPTAAASLEPRQHPTSAR